ncbi:MAG: hypothetical protein K0Q71_5752, partial [Thermomicrobiales bacterium]|nr:hypothetical protein [Thermomicrobiales bacterium]
MGGRDGTVIANILPDVLSSVSRAILSSDTH